MRNMEHVKPSFMLRYAILIKTLASKPLNPRLSVQHPTKTHLSRAAAAAANVT